MTMPIMFVTLEVSKLSGWLNADADCRGSKGGHAGAGRGSGREAEVATGDRGASRAQGGRDRLQIGSRAR